MATTIKLKRGAAANLPTAPAEGEPVFAKDTGKLYIGAGTGKVLINPGVVPGACATAAATAAKVVAISGYTPAAGDILAITFTNGNTANSPTLNISSGGAKQIRLAGIQPAGAKGIGPAYCEAGGTVYYCYDGTYYQQISSGYGYNLTTTATISKTIEIADLQAEINALPKILRHNVTLTVNEGEITTAITISGFSGEGGYLTINGANAASTYTHKVLNVIIQHCSTTIITIRGITATAVSGNAFYSVYNDGYIYLYMCNAIEGDKATAAFYGIRHATNSAVMYCSSCDLSNKFSAYYCTLAKLAVYLPIGVSNNRGFTSDIADVRIRSLNTLEADTMYYKVNGGSIIVPSGVPWKAVDTAGTGLTKSADNTLAHANYGIAGTYTKVTTNAQGHVTSGTSPTTLAEYGITDAVNLSGGTMTGELISQDINIADGAVLKYNGTTIIGDDGVIRALYNNDIAELFPRGDDEIEPGDVLAYDWRTDSVIKARKADKVIVGVCSDTYGFLLGGDKSNRDKCLAVALAGRVGVKVTGHVNPGDMLTISNISGIAMRKGKGGCVIGKALAPHDGDTIDRISMLAVVM
ncbi:MAG: hypothetical protein LBB94_10090 [Clostridiales bacterium]|nr:hypothetical protein [Clostridiales bacterium]